MDVLIELQYRCKEKRNKNYCPLSLLYLTLGVI